MTRRAMSHQVYRQRKAAAGRQDPLLMASMEVVAVEIVRAVVGSIGIVLAVPLTTAIAAGLVDRSLPFRRGRVGAGRPARGWDQP